MLLGMGEMNESHDSPSRIAKGLSDTMVATLSTALDKGQGHATGRVYGRTNTLAALVTRGLITAGRVHYLTDLGRRVMYAAGIVVTLLDDLHAEALAEDAERFPVGAPILGDLHAEALNEDWDRTATALWARFTNVATGAPEQLRAWLRRHRLNAIGALSTGAKLAAAADLRDAILRDHAEALDEEEHERFLAELREDVRKNGPTPKWEDGIPGPIAPIAPTGWTRLDDRSRHVLTGVEVVIIASEAGPAHFEVRVPRWIDGRKLMETVHRGSRFSAANWAMEVVVPDALYRLNGDHEYALRIDAQRTARRNRVQRVHVGDGRVIEEVRKPPLPGWTPEYSAKLAAEARNRIMTMDVRPGSLAEAAAIVDGVVKTAQLAVLQRLAAIIDQRESDIPGERIPADEVRHMLRNIAHQFRIEWP